MSQLFLLKIEVLIFHIHLSSCRSMPELASQLLPKKYQRRIVKTLHHHHLSANEGTFVSSFHDNNHYCCQHQLISAGHRRNHKGPQLRFPFNFDPVIVSHSRFCLKNEFQDFVSKVWDGDWFGSRIFHKQSTNPLFHVLFHPVE